MTLATSLCVRHAGLREPVKRCSVLLVTDDGFCTQRAVLESSGFLVSEVRSWPEDAGELLNHHVVIVRIRSMRNAPMVAARLRAKPRFGRRVLIGLVPSSVSQKERTEAIASGFDEVLDDTCDARQLIARILRRLRLVPEYHCMLPRKAA